MSAEPRVQVLNSCGTCIHFPVCRLFAGISQILAQQQGTSPIDPNNLATICECYRDVNKPTIIKVEMDTPIPTVEVPPLI